jgi:hypothetical protein
MRLKWLSLARKGGRWLKAGDAVFVTLRGSYPSRRGLATAPQDEDIYYFNQTTPDPEEPPIGGVAKDGCEEQPPVQPAVWRISASYQAAAWLRFSIFTRSSVP